MDNQEKTPTNEVVVDTQEVSPVNNTNELLNQIDILKNVNESLTSQINDLKANQAEIINLLTKKEVANSNSTLSHTDNNENSNKRKYESF